MTEPGGAARPIPCPRCGAIVAADQDWCLDCGAAARTRIATTPRWRAPVVALTAALALALGGLGFAFADLTADAGRLAPAPTTTAAPAALPPVSTSAPAVVPPTTVAPVIPPTTQATTPGTTLPTTTTPSDATGGAPALPPG